MHIIHAYVVRVVVIFHIFANVAKNANDQHANVAKIVPILITVGFLVSVAVDVVNTTIVFAVKHAKDIHVNAARCVINTKIARAVNVANI